MKSELFSCNHSGKNPDIVALYPLQRQYQRLYPLVTTFCLMIKNHLPPVICTHMICVWSLSSVGTMRIERITFIHSMPYYRNKALLLWWLHDRMRSSMCAGVMFYSIWLVTHRPRLITCLRPSVLMTSPSCAPSSNSLGLKSYDCDPSRAK